MYLKISAIVLAAGMSRRMGTDKLLLEYQGRSLLQRSADLLSELPVFERILITTCEHSEKITLPSNIQLIINQSSENGQSESVRLGIQAATGTHYLFMTADQPKLTPVDLKPFFESIEPDIIVYPVINNKPSSPTLLPARFKPELLALSGDTGGRSVRDAHPEICQAIVPARPENFVDIDYMEDYEKLKAETVFE